MSQNCGHDHGETPIFVQKSGNETRLKTKPSRQTHDKLPPDEVLLFSENEFSIQNYSKISDRDFTHLPCVREPHVRNVIHQDNVSSLHHSGEIQNEFQYHRPIT